MNVKLARMLAFFGIGDSRVSREVQWDHELT
jgi:hypothetical protein